MTNFIKPVIWEGDAIRLLNQQKLPREVEYIFLKTIEDVWNSITELKVRGAPAIGITAAFGLALWAKNSGLNELEILKSELAVKAVYLNSSRPTAVNLSWALQRLLKAAEEEASAAKVIERLETEAILIQQQDEETCKRIGEYGFSLLPDDATVLTHCNTGAIATSKYGTALGAFYIAKEQGSDIHVYATETRPVLQGARLTAWELQQADIAVTLITDNMAAHVLKTKNIDAILVGADRITANGDTANKIGTYGLAILAKAHGIPFYVAAPLSTIDLETATGDDIVIEERHAEEITHIGGKRIAPEDINVFNPAFDVTPHGLISGIVTEKGIVTGDYQTKLKALFEGVTV
ncbi:S-methyl-5-thioribose-1-phosphate isomerase [Jeotgalibacillus haloalkalitolerans]|uniref:Methylthioribose-1-phosphate isomerase n=1 Tax=Jeotgalibacillus haloalkalitolerans TaxID=3104292 RepID=A0ABU5KI94_9BACL|nr:S-methyl-5-thioribose-1-phosphate isomerase [Jeotgalibacillus sp. HH7-29]MDZ5710960.1 S-methyl-5-thioribose-1-phosphate isomerase [Jeotgalibacillus sp. HH7-29]